MKTAIEKIKAEMQKEQNPYVQVIGQFLLQHLQQHPEQAEKVMDGQKSIKKSLDVMRKEAEKKKVDNVAVLTDAEGFAIVLKYFGMEGEPVIPSVAATVVPVNVAEAQPAKRPADDFDVSLDDFL